MKQVRIAGSNDKRQITATPVTARTGEVLVLQLLWRGNTERCHPRHQQAHCTIYHDHTEKKMQNTASFLTLLKRTAAALAEQRIRHGLPPDMPGIMVVDNVSSHNQAILDPVGGVHSSCRLFKARNCQELYLYFGLPNRFVCAHNIWCCLHSIFTGATV